MTDTPEDKASLWPVQTIYWPEDKVLGEKAHWQAIAINLYYPYGEVNLVPDGEGATEEKATDACRREIAKLFRTDEAWAYEQKLPELIGGKS